MIVPWLFVAAGLLVSVLGIHLRRKTQRLIARSRRGMARVESARNSGDGITGSRATYSVLRLDTDDGRSFEIESRIGMPGGAYTSGQLVAVLYDPADPASAVVDSAVELHLPWIIFLGVGICKMLAGAAVLVFHAG